MENKIKIARNEEAQVAIVQAAMYSLTGNMIYRKWDKQSKRFIRKRYEIIPIDCGISSAGNSILYAEDYRDNKQIKMFIINQIERFQVGKRKVRPAFPIKLNNIRKMFNNVKDEDLINEQNSNENSF